MSGTVDILLRIAGVVSGIGYTLSRYRVLGFPLDVLAMLGSLAVVVWQTWDGWMRGYAVSHALIVVLCLSLSALMVVLRPRRFVVFRDESLSIPVGVPELCPEENVEIRVTGFLEVQGQRRHFVEAPAFFQTTKLREHIVMARLWTRRSMGPVKSVAGEWGWWYAFISPAKVRSIDWTRIYHGLARRRAIRVVYTMENGKGNTLFLSSAGPGSVARVAQDLRLRSGLRDGGL